MEYLQSLGNYSAQISEHFRNDERRRQRFNKKLKESRYRSYAQGSALRVRNPRILTRQPRARSSHVSPPPCRSGRQRGASGTAGRTPRETTSSCGITGQARGPRALAAAGAPRRPHRRPARRQAQRGAPDWTHSPPAARRFSGCQAPAGRCPRRSSGSRRQRRGRIGWTGRSSKWWWRRPRNCKRRPASCHTSETCHLPGPTSSLPATPDQPLVAAAAAAAAAVLRSVSRSRYTTTGTRPLLLHEMQFSPRQRSRPAASQRIDAAVQPPSPRGPAAVEYEAAAKADAVAMMAAAALQDAPATVPAAPSAPRLPQRKCRPPASAGTWRPEATVGAEADRALARLMATGKAVPLPCLCTAFAAKTVPFLAVLRSAEPAQSPGRHRESLVRHRCLV